MAPPKYRVQACTYNGHLGVGSSPASPDLSSWLVPTLSTAAANADHDHGHDPPDVIAIGFQEMIPLHLALVGLTSTALDLHDAEIHAAIEKHAGGAERETYSLMAKKVLGGISLLVYTRDKTVTSLVVDVRVATAATGVFRVMGNKGAVGVRITLDDLDSGEKASPVEKHDTGNTVFTFVTAHLAAHDSGLQRRNEDWQSIVERLVFSPDGASEHYKPRREKDIFQKMKEGLEGSSDGIQIYDTSYLFFFGDLNYRISTKTPKPLPLHLISHKMANDLPSLLVQDQLLQERAANRTLHHLKEGVITFQPTYKYIVGTVNEFKKFSSRVPGWCDRVLYATWADEGAGTIVKKLVSADGEEVEKVAKRKGTKVELYTSIMSFTQSDHKPVTAIIALPRAPKGSRALRLPHAAPFPIDPLWRRKQFIGWLADRGVGFFWCILMLAGLGKDTRLGITTLGGAALAAWWYRALLFGL